MIKNPLRRVFCFMVWMLALRASLRDETSNRTTFDEEPGPRKQKTRLLGGFFRIMVPGLGIEPRTRGFSIPCSTD